MIRFTLRVTLFSLIASLICALAFTLWVLSTPSGARFVAGFANKMMPSLVMDVEQGNLLSGLDLRYFAWRDTDVPKQEATRVELMGVQLDWSWSCLFSGELCVNKLHADRLMITIPSSSDTQESSGLSEVSLPFPLHLKEGQISVLSILSGSNLTEIRDVALAADWQGSEIQVGRLALSYEGVGVSGSGLFGMGQPWKMDIAGALTGLEPMLGSPDWARRLGLGKALPFRLYGENLFLHLDTELGGEVPLSAQINFDTQPVSMPFQITLQSSGEVPWEYEAYAGGIKSWELDWRGSLDTLETQLTFRASDERYGLVELDAPISISDEALTLGESRIHTDHGNLNVSGQLLSGDKKKAERDRLDFKVRLERLQLQDTPIKQPVEVNGEIRLAGSMEGDHFDSDWTLTNLALAYFQPQNPGQPLRTRLNGTIRVDGDSQNQNIEWTLKSSQSGFPVESWQARVVINPDKIRIHRSEVKAAKTVLRTSGEIALAPSLGWSLDFDLVNFTPGLVKSLTEWQAVEWDPGSQWKSHVREGDQITLKGKAIGGISDQGGLSTLSVALSKMDGVLNGQPLSGKGQLHWVEAGETLKMDVALVNAEAAVTIKGVMAPHRSQLTGNLKQLDIGSWLPGWEGVASANIEVAGSIHQPDVRADFDLTDLSHNDLRVGRLKGKVDLTRLGKAGAEGQVLVSSVKVGVNALTDASLAFKGKLDQLDVHAEAKSPELGALAMVCSLAEKQISATGQSIDATCRSLDYARNGQDWGLTAPFLASVLLDDSAGPKVSVRGLCLQAKANGSAEHAGSLCLSQLNKQQNVLDAILALDEIELQQWVKLTDQDIPLKGRISGEVRIIDTDGVPLFAKMAFRSQELSSVHKSHSAVKDLLAELTLEKDVAHFSLSGATPGEGRISAAIAVQGVSGPRSLDGKISLTDLGLAGISALYPDMGQLSGTLAAQADLAGSLSEPVIQGGWTIRQGSFQGVGVEFSLEDIQLDGTFNGDAMHFGGLAEAPGGKIAVEGDLNWQEDWYLDLTAKSDNVVLVPQTGVELTVRPELFFRLQQGLASLNGTVQIPKADILLQTLPQNARSVSSDVVYVETETEKSEEEGGSAWKFALNVRLDLGEKVHFKGLGVDTYLQGGVRLTQRDDGVLTAGGLLSASKGELTYWGQTLKLDTADLVFQGALDNPQVNIRASRKIVSDGVTVGLSVTGNALKPNVGVFSEPEMDETDASYYLVTGRKPEPGQTVGSEVLSNMLISSGGLAGGWIAGGLMEKVGVSDFQINTQSEAGGTTVQLTGYITPDLQLRYGVKLFDEVNSLAMRYRLGSNLFIEAMSGLNTSLDVIYSFEIK